MKDRMEKAGEAAKDAARKTIKNRGNVVKTAEELLNKYDN